VLRKSKWIQEKKMTSNPNISSFNFTRDAFWERQWNSSTIKARGLFINTISGEIVARSYEKFFNLDEREEGKLENLGKTLQFPITLYGKENGFLGLISWDYEKDQLFTATKSSDQGNYVGWFRNILKHYYLENIEKFVKENNVTLVCEVIDPINDPHIIKYDGATHIFLLDIVRNDLVFSKYSYDDTCNLSDLFGFAKKSLYMTFGNYIEFFNWYRIYTELLLEEEEGYVIEDSSGYMIKIKSLYYKFWKFMRSLKEQVGRGRKVDTKILNTALANNFINWLYTLDREEVANSDIITLRSKYYDQAD
jgi:tRNA splicing ligase